MPVSPILVFHICAGLAGLLSGTAAMCFRKGSRGHRTAGKVFVIAMLSMSVSATYLAVMKHQITNILAAVLTFYLVSTAWVTARRKDGQTGIFDYGALLFAAAVGSIEVVFGLQALTNGTGHKYGYPAGIYLFMGSVVLLGAALDVRMLVRGGVSGVDRIARHLWRMCFALFIASGSFFLGQPQVFPASLRNSNLLIIPGILPLFLLIFWMFRVRLTKTYKQRAVPREADRHPVMS